MTTAARSPARERILDVADRLFYGRGIRAVGIDTLVAESGAAKTTLYSHFRSKDDLVAAYLRRRSERWLAHLDAELHAHRGTPAEKIEHVFDVLGDWFSEPGYRGCPFINACSEFADADHPARKVVREHRGRLHSVLTGLCSEAGAKTPDVLAAGLLLVYDGAMVAANIERDPSVADAAKTAAAALVAAGRS
jgi:AcrR family transcriptional regulator